MHPRPSGLLPLLILLLLPAGTGAIPSAAGRSIEVNLPAFSVRLFGDGFVEREWRCRIGKRSTPTLTGEGRISGRFAPAYFRYDGGERAGEIIGRSTIRRYVGGPEVRTIEIPYAERVRGLELELGGRVSGQILHTTTNPETVGHVHSSGCVGLYEEDMLELFSLAPVGTPVRVTYRLAEYDEGLLRLHRDVYDTGGDAEGAIRPLLSALGLSLGPRLERRLALEAARAGSVDLAGFLGRRAAAAAPPPAR